MILKFHATDLFLFLFKKITHWSDTSHVIFCIITHARRKRKFMPKTSSLQNYQKFQKHLKTLKSYYELLRKSVSKYLDIFGPKDINKVVFL